MAAWLWRRGTKPVDGSTARDPIADLRTVDVYLADSIIHGRIDPGGRRLSDALAGGASLRLAVVGEDGQLGWHAIEGDSILIVAPPPLATSARRLHRRRCAARAVVGPYRVSGVAHLPPGAVLDEFIQRTAPSFLPLTRATITHRQPSELYVTHEVVIVNRRRVTDLTEPIGLV